MGERHGAAHGAGGADRTSRSPSRVAPASPGTQAPGRHARALRRGRTAHLLCLGTDITEHETLRRELESLTGTASPPGRGPGGRQHGAARHSRSTQSRRADLERGIARYAEEMIVPLLETLRTRLGSAPEVIYADAAIQNLRELANPWLRRSTRLPPGRRGSSARARDRQPDQSGQEFQRHRSSPVRVGHDSRLHRKNLRRKLGLGTRSPSLATYLTRPLPPHDGTAPAAGMRDPGAPAGPPPRHSRRLSNSASMPAISFR